MEIYIATLYYQIMLNNNTLTFKLVFYNNFKLILDS